MSQDRKKTINVTTVSPEAEPQALTPQKGTNLENAAYAAWKAAEGYERTKVEMRLYYLLRLHATRVCWMVLRTNHPDIVDEIAQDILIQLPTFREECLFSTWVHSWIKFRCIKELRILNRNVQLKDVHWEELNRSQSPERRVLMKQLYDSVSPEQRRLIDLKIYDKRSLKQMSEELGCSVGWVKKMWEETLKELRKNYNGRRQTLKYLLARR